MKRVTVEAEDGGTKLFNETYVRELQDNVSLTDGVFSGTLKYFDTPGAITNVWGNGNFLATKFSVENDDWTAYDSVMVGLEPSAGSGLQELINDPDKNAIMKITDKDTQVLKVVATKAGKQAVKTYSLRGLTVESDEA